MGEIEAQSKVEPLNSQGMLLFSLKHLYIHLKIVKNS